MKTSFKTINILSLSTANRAQIQAQEKCACYYCAKIYQSNLIVEWRHLEKRGYYEGQETAFCPFCGIDAVIPFQEEIDISFLEAAKDFWFSSSTPPILSNI